MVVVSVVVRVVVVVPVVDVVTVEVAGHFLHDTGQSDATAAHTSFSSLSSKLQKAESKQGPTARHVPAVATSATAKYTTPRIFACGAILAAPRCGL